LLIIEVLVIPLYDLTQHRYTAKTLRRGNRKRHVLS
jgi:hypothetical protein